MALTYSTQEVVDQIGAPSHRWLLQRVRSREFPGRKIGRHWRFTDEDIAVILRFTRNDNAGTAQDSNDDADVFSTPQGLTPRSRRRALA
jgi:hypothetical protein